MSMLTIEIHCDTKAFGQPYGGLVSEIARILNEYASVIASSGKIPKEIMLRDFNGIPVGLAEYEETRRGSWHIK